MESDKIRHSDSAVYDRYATLEWPAKEGRCCKVAIVDVRTVDTCSVRRHGYHSEARILNSRGRVTVIEMVRIAMLLISKLRYPLHTSPKGVGGKSSGRDLIRIERNIDRIRGVLVSVTFSQSVVGTLQLTVARTPLFCQPS